MKNKNFFYLQYDKINWANQENTKINSLVNNYIIKNIILKKKSPSIRVFDIGFGIGFFMNMLKKLLKPLDRNMVIEGCEPSKKNYEYFKKHLDAKDGHVFKTYNSTFLNTRTKELFDFITAIYVFPHILIEDLEKTVQKINAMLKEGGKFVLVVANETYLKNKLRTMKDLFIEKNSVQFGGKKYDEVLHYSDIPEIGKVIDYNREEQFYIDIFKNNNFKLTKKMNLDDNGFVCTVFVFEKV